ncbi:HEPN domain-containing protein [Raoultella planticola]|nr:HEPN domain-containing protein [Raoultella planticola]
MCVNSIDFVSAARLCLNHGDEVGYRSCISRAYYGMFHEAMTSLTNVPAYSANHHGNLIGYMTTASECKNEPFDKHKLKVMGYNLKQMRDCRNEADYDITEVTVSKEMAEAGIEAADIFFGKWLALKEAKAS